MNRTGTYVAFDGLGETNPTKSDFRYYATLQAWTAHKNIEFSFVNSHDKTYAVRDTSSKATLYARIRQCVKEKMLQKKSKTNHTVIIFMIRVLNRVGCASLFHIKMRTLMLHLKLEII